jgi:hypothetical protein
LKPLKLAVVDVDVLKEPETRVDPVDRFVSRRHHPVEVIATGCDPVMRVKGDRDRLPVVEITMYLTHVERGGVEREVVVTHLESRLRR